MLALFLGTVALPHVLIRYYMVPDAASARKSTIVALGIILRSPDMFARYGLDPASAPII